jgi:DNA repair exonuclease SbcCD ATPase subunit
MSQVNVEEVKKLIDHAEKLKSTINELRRHVETSELASRVETLENAIDALRSFIRRVAGDFAIRLDRRFDNDVYVDIYLRGKLFVCEIRVPESASIIELYRSFFDNKEILETLVSRLVDAMIRVSEEVRKSVDVLGKIGELQEEIKTLRAELDEIAEKLEDP